MTTARAYELIHPDDREPVRRAREEAVRERRRWVLEYRLVRPDGQVRYVRCENDLLYNEEGRPRGTFGTVQDITERKRAEEALRKAEEKYQGIFKHAIEGIFQTTPGGQYVTANPALARILGYDSPQELISGRTDIARQQYAEPERRAEFKRLIEAPNVVQGFEVSGLPSGREQDLAGCGTDIT